MSLVKIGDVYHYDFWFNRKRYKKSTGLTNAKAAQKVEDLKKDSLKYVAAGLPDPLAELELPPTLSEAIPGFLAWSERVHRKATVALHRVNCAVLERYFGERRLDQITRGDVQDFMVERSKESRTNVVGERPPTGEDAAIPDRQILTRDLFRVQLRRYQRATVGRERRVRDVQGTVSSVTVNRAVSTLRLLYGHARGKYPNLVNPARGGKDGIQLFPETEVQRILSDDEFARYLKFTTPDLSDVARIMRQIGPRPQDVCSLTIPQCDFKLGTVEFWPKPRRTKLVAMPVERGKTKNSARTIAFPPIVRKILEERVAAARELGTEFLFPMQTYRGRRGTLILDRSRTPNSLNKPHNRAIRKAGIRDRVRLYDLRHTFATTAVRNGMHPRTLQDMLGHSDPKMTMRYTVKHDLTAQRAYFAGLEQQ